MYIYSLVSCPYNNFIAFFFVAGEELSWGQRIIGIETTEYFKENNVQEELNLT